MELNTDMILSGGGGLAVGTGVGWVLKRTVTIIFKLLMVLGVFFIGALVYLQSIRVIEINEQALNNLMNEGYNQINNVMGHEAMINPIAYIATNLGIPMSSGLVLGMVVGWSKA